MLVPEDRANEGLILGMSVKENITLAIINVLVKLGIIDFADDTKIAKSIIQKLSIDTPGPGQIVRYLSGGNQQKVVVGKGLAFDARLFIFDEVTQGVDVQAKGQFYKTNKRSRQKSRGLHFYF